MKKPLFTLFMVALFVSVASCAIAGNIVLSAVEAVSPSQSAVSASANVQPSASNGSAASGATASGTVSATHTSAVPPADMKSNGPADLKLVDLSHNNNVTSWSDLKGVVDGVYIKATQGVTITDPKFIEYATAAISRHIPTGFYHYFTPADEANARQQADHFYAAVKGFTYNLIPVLDVEETDNQSASAVCADVKAFEKEFLKLSGHKLMIYCSPTFADNNLSDPSLAQYPLWIAHYNVNTPRSTIAWQTYDMWQYGSAIKVAGILKPVDADFATSGIFLDPSKAPTPKGVLATSSK